MPKLIVSGVGYDLVEQVVTIGRAPDNTIHIDDPSVSSRHAELRRGDKTYQLRDLASTNGTRVNGTGASEITLHPGDRVRFGAVDARFEGDMADSWAKQSPTTIDRTKFQRRKSDRYAGTRCGCCRLWIDPIITAPKKSIWIGSHRASSRLDVTICFTAGRAIAWNPCALRNVWEFLRL